MVNIMANTIRNMGFQVRPYQQKMVHNPSVKPPFAGEGSFFWVVDFFYDTMLKRQALQ